jgi:hypothetical protein
MDSAVGSTAAVCCVRACGVLGCYFNRAAPALRDCLDLVLQSARVVSLIFLSPVQRRFSQALSRFQREAKAASVLNHPNNSTIHELTIQHGQAFVAMEFQRSVETFDCQIARSTAVKLSNDVDDDTCDVISLRFFTGKRPSSRCTFRGAASGAAPVGTHILENSVGTELHVSPESSCQRRSPSVESQPVAHLAMKAAG